MLPFFYSGIELSEEDLNTSYMIIYYGLSSLQGPPVYPKDMEAFREILYRDIEAATTAFTNLSKTYLIIIDKING